jgi:hypothetical protein
MKQEKQKNPSIKTPHVKKTMMIRQELQKKKGQEKGMILG